MLALVESFDLKQSLLLMLLPLFEGCVFHEKYISEESPCRKRVSHTNIRPTAVTCRMVSHKPKTPYVHQLTPSLISTYPLLQGVSGRIIFGERLIRMWFFGATLVIAGVMLMVGSTDSSTDSNTDSTTDTKPEVKTGDGAVKKTRNMDYSPPKTRSKLD